MNPSGFSGPARERTVSSRTVTSVTQALTLAELVLSFEAEQAVELGQSPQSSWPSECRQAARLLEKLRAEIARQANGR